MFAIIETRLKVGNEFRLPRGIMAEKPRANTIARSEIGNYIVFVSGRDLANVVGASDFHGSVRLLLPFGEVHKKSQVVCEIVR